LAAYRERKNKYTKRRNSCMVHFTIILSLRYTILHKGIKMEALELFMASLAVFMVFFAVLLRK